MATDSPSGVVKRWVIDDLEAYRKEHAGDAPSSKYRFFQTTEKAANPGRANQGAPPGREASPRIRHLAARRARLRWMTRHARDAGTRARFASSDARQRYQAASERCGAQASPISASARGFGCASNRCSTR